MDGVAATRMKSSILINKFAHTSQYRIHSHFSLYFSSSHIFFSLLVDDEVITLGTQREHTFENIVQIIEDETERELYDEIQI